MPILSKKEISAILTATRWNPLGEGTYNKVYVSETPLTINDYTAYWVKKVRKVPTDKVSDSERATRKWNTINPDYPAYEVDGIWIAPYLGKTPAPDSFVADAVINIYRRTRNIVIDACGQDNFLLVGAQAVCVDVDFARRKGSIVSDEPAHWLYDGLGDYLNSYHSTRPTTTSLIRTLLYLEAHVSVDSIKNEYLTHRMLNKLRLFRTHKIQLTPELIEAAIPLPQAPFLKFLQILCDLQKANLSLTNPGISLLLTTVQFDIHNELANDKLIEFIDHTVSEAPINALMRLAAELGLLRLIQTLLAHDSTLLNTQDRYNVTPLIRAIASKKSSIENKNAIVQYLIAMGANVNVQLQCEDEAHLHGLTALDYAINAKLTTGIDSLRKAGALTRDELKAKAELAASDAATVAPSGPSPVPAAAPLSSTTVSTPAAASLSATNTSPSVLDNAGADATNLTSALLDGAKDASSEPPPIMPKTSQDAAGAFVSGSKANSSTNDEVSRTRATTALQHYGIFAIEPSSREDVTTDKLPAKGLARACCLWPCF